MVAEAGDAEVLVDVDAWPCGALAVVEAGADDVLFGALGEAGAGAELPWAVLVPEADEVEDVACVVLELGTAAGAETEVLVDGTLAATVAESLSVDVEVVVLAPAGWVVTVAGAVTVGVAGTERPSARAIGGNTARKAGAASATAARPAAQRSRHGTRAEVSELQSSREATVTPPAT